MIWFAILAVALGAFATGFVIGTAYGVGKEEEAELERAAFRRRYGGR